MASEHVFESYIRATPNDLWRALTHRDLDSDSSHAQAILGGWPVILSGLKTFLETGEPLVLNA